MTNDLYLGAVKLRSTIISKDERRDVSNLDLAIFVLGWETRSSHVAQAMTIVANKVVGLRFESQSRTIDVRKDATEAAIKKIHRDLSVTTFLAAANYFENCGALEALISGYYRSAGRPLNIGLDITCLPKMYIAFLVAFLFKRGIVAKLHVFYAEGVYAVLPPEQSEKAKGLSFSAGEWDTVDVPYIEASILADYDKRLIMSVGAEIRQAKVYMGRFEPNRLAILGVNNSDRRLDLSKVPDSKGMKSLYESVVSGGGEAQSFEIDDLQSLASCCTRIIDTFGPGRVTVLAVGCKPHTLAMAVVALAYPQIELVCRKPGASANYDATPLGPVHHYALVDRFEPFAFLR